MTPREALKAGYARTTPVGRTTAGMMTLGAVQGVAQGARSSALAEKGFGDADAARLAMLARMEKTGLGLTGAEEGRMDARAASALGATTRTALAEAQTASAGQQGGVSGRDLMASRMALDTALTQQQMEAGRVKAEADLEARQAQRAELQDLRARKAQMEAEKKAARREMVSSAAALALNAAMPGAGAVMQAAVKGAEAAGAAPPSQAQFEMAGMQNKYGFFKKGWGE